MTITENSPILCSPRATPEQCQHYIFSRAHGEYTEGDIASVIVPAYWRVCCSVGVDPLIAIAQMIHETGNLTSWWSQRPRRNPAGIGVTGAEKQISGTPPDALKSTWAARGGRWYEGVSFAAWEDAIPAHIGRLLAYIFKVNETNEQQHDLVVQALNVRPIHIRARGTAPTLKPLGAAHNPANVGLPRNKWVAGWAWPGTDYGVRLAQIATQIAGL